MSGNRFRFGDAIQKANDAAWADSWTEAVQCYQRALAEFPDDAATLMGYAWALLNAGAYDQAIAVYQKLIKMNPAEPGPYERIAEMLERQAKTVEAAQLYAHAAMRYRKQGLAAKATSSLEASVRLVPANIPAWEELLKHYRAQQDVAQAVLAALWLVHLYQSSDRNCAMDVCRQMQEFVPHEPRLGQALMMLQTGRTIPAPPAFEVAPVIEEAVAEDLPEASAAVAQERGTPTDIAVRSALARLANALFSEELPASPDLSAMEVTLWITRAIDSQTRGDLDEAAIAYARLIEAGVELPSIRFNLGLIYKEHAFYERAIEHLNMALSDPEYVLGSHYAIAECHRLQANYRQALTHYLTAAKILDLATVAPEHVSDLGQVYEGIASDLVSSEGLPRLQELCAIFSEFFGRPDWEAAAVHVREGLDVLTRDGIVLPLATLVTLPHADMILEAMGQSQAYVEQGLSYSALEELFFAVSQAPEYLPLHYLVAKVLQATGHTEEAAQKYRIVARAYEIRGQSAQAFAIYRLIAAAAPLDIAVRRRIADLQIQSGRFDDALDQYMQISEAYYQLAQPERARETYVEALRLSSHGSPARGWDAEILRRMADLDEQRLDWYAAIKDNEDLIRVAPDDEKAYVKLYQLYGRTGRTQLGVAALDKFLKRSLVHRRVAQALAVLENLVESEPEMIPLRARLAQLYLNLGRRDEALENLDVLGDLQLEAGQKDAVVKTLEAILALNPPSREGYLDLYQKLTNGETSPPTR